MEKIVHNVETGEVLVKQMTKAELAEWQKTKDELEATKLAEKTQAEAKEAARQSALEKLAALGLTEAEIQALAG